MAYGQKYLLEVNGKLNYPKNAGVLNRFIAKIFQRGYITGGGIQLTPAQVALSTNLSVGGLTISSTASDITIDWTADQIALYGKYPLIWAYFDGQWQAVVPQLDNTDNPTEIEIDLGLIPATDVILVIKPAESETQYTAAYLTGTGGVISFAVTSLQVYWIYYDNQLQPIVPVFNNIDTPTLVTIDLGVIPSTNAYLEVKTPDAILTYTNAQLTASGGVISITPDLVLYGQYPRFYAVYDGQFQPITPVITPSMITIDLGTIPTGNTYILIVSGGYAVGIQELTGALNPISIQGISGEVRDKMQPLKGSKAVIRVIVDGIDLEDIWTDDETEYYTEISRETDDDTFTINWSLDETIGVDNVDRNLRIDVNGVTVLTQFTNGSGTLQVNRGDLIVAVASSGIAWPVVSNAYSSIMVTGLESVLSTSYLATVSMQIASADKDISIDVLSYYIANYMAMRSEVFYNSTSGYPVTYSPTYLGATQVIADALALADTDFYVDGQAYADAWPIGYPAIWRGFMLPDELQQAYQDKPVLEIGFVDGIGLLKNLLFADNDGNYFLGKMTPKDIIYQCLYRIGIPDMNIYIHAEIFELSMSLSEDPMVQVTHQLETYYLSTQTKPLDLGAVMEAVLRLYGLELRQNMGEWWLTQIDTMFDAGSKDWFKYSYITGEALATVSKDWTRTLGCTEGAYDNIFILSDQLKMIDKAYRGQILNYQFKGATNITENPNLIPTVSGGGYIWDGWTVSPLGSGNVNPGAGGNGARMDSDAVRPADPTVVSITTDPVPVSPGDMLVFDLNFNNTGSVAFGQASIKFTNSAAQTYYLADNGTWGLSVPDAPMYFYNGQVIDSPATPYLYSLDSDLSVNIVAEAIPNVLTGNVVIILYNYDYSQNNSLGALETNDPTYPNFAGTTTWNLGKSSFAIVQDATGETALGTFYIAANVGNKTYTPPILAVLNADDDTARYVGTLYREDESTPTEYWSRANTSYELKRLLWIIAETYVRMYQSPFRIMQGTIGLWYPQLTRFTIEDGTDWPGVYMNVGTDYELPDMMNRANLIQISNEDITGAPTTIEETDYGQYSDDVPVIMPG